MCTCFPGRGRGTCSKLICLSPRDGETGPWRCSEIMMVMPSLMVMVMVITGPLESLFQAFSQKHLPRTSLDTKEEI